MGLIDRLIDKIIDRLKRNKADNMVKQLRKQNPSFSSALDDYNKAIAKMKKSIDQEAERKGIKL